MNISIKTLPLLAFISFFCLSWFSVEDELTTNNCVVDLGQDLIIPFWESYQLDALINRPDHEIEEIIWSSPEKLSCSDCLDPFLVVNEAEDFCISLTVKFDDGCEAIDEKCIFFQECYESGISENKINGISPQDIVDSAELEFEVAQFQFVRIEIVDNDEVTHSLFEDWLGSGLQSVNLDFSAVPSGEHTLKVRLYPEDLSITINKQ